MQDILNEMRKAERLNGEFEHATREFELAAQSEDEARMESARLKVHEIVDMKLDAFRRLYKMKDENMISLMKKIQQALK